ncbi:MAG: DMT family transporter [Alphaproteobacteria bacterium]|nr:DMT family transporter [Alphaproteobacteria bacterium]
MTASPAAPVIGHRTGLILVLMAGLCWSILGLFVRLMENPEAWAILFYRSLALSIFLFLVIAARSGGRPLAVYRRAGRAGVLGGLALVLAFSGSIVSVVNTTVANAMFLFATAPFIAALLGRVLIGERVRRATWIAMAVGLVGVAIMVAEGIAVGHLFGNAAALVSALGFALFTIALRSGRNDDMLPAVSLGGLFMTAVALAICLGGGVSLALSTNDTLLALGLGVCQLGFGLSLYTIGSKALPAAELTLLAMTEVVFGPLWVWIFLGETASPWTWVGGAILIAAITGNALGRLRHRPPPLAP